MKKGFPLLLILMVFISGCDRRASDKDDVSKYYPLKVGNVWIYTDSGQNLTMKKEVVEYSNKYNAYKVNNIVTLPPVPPTLTSSGLVDIRDNSVRIVGGRNLTNQPEWKINDTPEIILKAPLKVGKTWGITLENGDKYQYKIIAFVNHRVKAGDFQDACKVEYVISGEVDGKMLREIKHYYYAPHVGLIDTIVIESMDSEDKKLLPYSLFELSEYKLTENNQQAINDFDSAININPKDAVAYYNRGSNYGFLGNYQQAINDFNKAIELNPKYAEAYVNRGDNYSALENYQQALNDLNKAIELNPKHANAFYTRGHIYGNLRNHQQAINDFNKAIELNPKYAEAYVNRGVNYSALENYQHALNDFNKAIELNPNEAENYYNRGFVYVELGNHRRAINDFSKAIELNPKHAGAYRFRAIAYEELGNNKLFIENLQMAAQLGNKQAQQYLSSHRIQWQ